jgi:hypothetical protein
MVRQKQSKKAASFHDSAVSLHFPLCLSPEKVDLRLLQHSSKPIVSKLGLFSLNMAESGFMGIAGL